MKKFTVTRRDRKHQDPLPQKILEIAFMIFVGTEIFMNI